MIELDICTGMPYICTAMAKRPPRRKIAEPVAPGAPGDRRTEILDATLLLIAEGGIDAIRYRDVAARAGVPLGTVSYHYPARPDLLAAAFRHYFARNSELLRGLGARAPRRSIDDVPRFLAALIRLDFVERRPLMLAEYELILYAARQPALALVLAAWDRTMIAELAPVLEAFEVGSPIATARSLVDLLRGFQLVHLSRNAKEIEAPLGDFERRARALLLSATGHTKGTTHGKSHQAHPTR